MKRLICRAVAILMFVTAGMVPSAQAQDLNQIGVTLLRAVTTNLNGSGIRVAQPEAAFDRGTNWEVNPAAAGQPAGLFTYLSADGSTNVFPNTLSSESGHADAVAQHFFGIPGGVATNVAHVDNYEADYFITNYVFNLVPMPSALVVNQSFTFGPLSVEDQQGVDSSYDDYADTFGTMFISAVANGGPVYAPGTAYNCIAVAAYGGDSSVGPTIDNGRCKPDITAPAQVTSLSTPLVSGSATVLLQAGFRGDGGSDTNAATDMRTIKALLLNGAVKPANWTNQIPAPLDYRYGAGVLNVFNAYEQLAGGKHDYVVATSVPTNNPHFPARNTGTIDVLNGWDFNTNSSSASTDGVNHYYFDVTNSLNGADFSATATLAWNRQLGATNINDLDLFLYNTVGRSLVACSTSRVDNVEHIWVPQLSPGRYDLQVLKHGGPDVVSDAEAYALAFEFFSQTLSLNQSDTNLVLTWPVYPAGFVVETTTSLAPASWLALTNLPVLVTNQQNWLLLTPTNGGQFFRLRLP